MGFLELAQKRHSVRRYQDRELEQEKLDALLDAVNAAPSAGDLQGYEVILVREPATKDALARAAYGQAFVAQAPAVLVFCADHLRSASKYGQRGADLYAVQDATIAAAYAQLAAAALGLATCWVGAFDPKIAAYAVGTPEQITPVAIMPVGYPAEEPEPTPRRPLSDLVHQETF